MNVFGVNEVDLFTRIYAYSVSMENFGAYVYVRIWASQKVSWTTHIYVFGSKEVKLFVRINQSLNPFLKFIQKFIIFSFKDEILK